VPRRPYLSKPTASLAERAEDEVGFSTVNVYSTAGSLQHFFALHETVFSLASLELFKHYAGPPMYDGRTNPTNRAGPLREHDKDG
jgi:hypothetical protein